VLDLYQRTGKIWEGWGSPRVRVPAGHQRRAARGWCNRRIWWPPVEMELSTGFGGVRWTHGCGRRVRWGPGGMSRRDRSERGREELRWWCGALIAACFGQRKASDDALEQGKERETKMGQRNHLETSETSSHLGSDAALRRRIAVAWRCVTEWKKGRNREGTKGIYRHEHGRNLLPKSSGIKSGRIWRSDAVTGEKSGWRKKKLRWPGQWGSHVSEGEGEKEGEDTISVISGGGPWAEIDAGPDGSPGPFHNFHFLFFFSFSVFLFPL
jgi:hypothetical protein